MSLQPIDQVRQGASYRLGLDFTNRHPALGVAVAEAIARWSGVEQALGLLFISMLRINEQQGASLYAAFESAGSKRAALRSLCVASLKNDELVLTTRLLQHVASEQKLRDKLAHWIFGSSDEIPNALVMIDPKTTWAAAGAALQELRTLSGDELEAFEVKPVDRNKVFVYSLGHIYRDALRFTSLATLVLQFTKLVAIDLGRPERAVLFGELNQDARLQTA